MKEIVAILALGVGAQWAAWRLGVPAILLLLLFGLLAGPVFGVLRAVLMHPAEPVQPPSSMMAETASE